MIRLSVDRCAVAAALLFLLLMVLPVASAHAAPCDSAGPHAGEIARLKRQIAANRSFEEKHDCAAGGGFACREIAGRISAASVKLASLQGAAPMCAAPGKVAATTKPARGNIRLAAQHTKLPARMETRCVRLSDGYYFPTPNSGFSTAGDVTSLAAQCRFICDDPAMDVYRIGADRDADTMISLTTGAAYADLPNAGAYRAAAASKACDMSRFYKAALAGKQDVSVEMSPRLKAEDDPESVAMETSIETTAATELALWNDTPLRGTRSLTLDLPKKIRVVGAVYLPEE
ncbi:MULTISPECIES: DUF2865 domain-containing protein [unclassified Rhizobium]|uniref:DUF2865 domain-containing protein n=1 Tax=unclassified Rhizobium TaxID=2613769 RepID=UPI0007017117|nr:MULTISPECIES: DUF2865 domain-containing protein [unclassified Rhizobium]KQV44368.1 hypothetical protein ASC86_06310 [Rhizobium sp. Root1212]KRD38549.1 hypothetical protein ASE37_06310 [Rhizobium sp. Root268]